MDTLDEIDTALDAFRRAAPADRESAGNALITAMFRRIQNRASLMLGDYPRVQQETGDVVADVFFRLRKALNDPEVAGRLQTHQDCLRLVAFHLRLLLLDLARRVRQLAPLPSGDLTGDTPAETPDEFAAGLEEQARLYEAVEGLEPELRVVIEYADLEGLTNVEVARRLGVNESTVRYRRERAKQALADKLGL